MVAILAIEIDSEGGIKTTKTVTQCVGEWKCASGGKCTGVPWNSVREKF